MTLGRLILGWLPVALWFVIATFGVATLVAALQRPTGESGVSAGFIPRGLLKWRIVEAAIVTLFASLWFDSLGSGGWWLLFLLVGILVTAPNWLGGPLPARIRVVGASGDLARYVVAGAILAWRLG